MINENICVKCRNLAVCKYANDFAILVEKINELSKNEIHNEMHEIEVHCNDFRKTIPITRGKYYD